MSRQNASEQALKDKLAELRELRNMRAEVDKSIEELKESYGKLNREIDITKGEIRFLGGKVPVGTEYAERMVLWRQLNGRRTNETASRE